MSYLVDWVAKEVSIPTSDLTLISGSRYSLNMSDFLAEIRRLEWEPTEGLWAPAILDHDNTRVAFAGANYAPFDAVINGYTFRITGAATRVDLIGSNNDLIDSLIPTGVSMVPSNSAGLQIVATNVGLTEAQDAKLTAISVESDEIHKRLSLDSNNPVKTHDNNKIEIGPDGAPIIEIEAVNDTTSTTQTRTP